MDDEGFVFWLGALAVVGVMVGFVWLMGLGPSAIMCWLELSCRP